MKILKFNYNFKAFYIDVKSFPDEIGSTFQELFKYFPNDDGRKIMGISKYENGKFSYKVAAEILHNDELSIHKLPILEIENGSYVYIEIKNFISNIDLISEAFTNLISNTNIDPNGYCIELYKDNDVLCLVKLEN